MSRKQARRRKQKQKTRLKLPRVSWRRVSVPLLALGVVALCYRFTAAMLDRPIDAITIEGPFQRVTALQIEEAINGELGSGFFSADLDNIQALVTSLPWIDDAIVARRWPGTIEISVTEQIPAAIWGERGLLNTEGTLFVSDARHVPAELPRLSGPEHQESAVASRYLTIRERLIPLGLDVRRLHLDARGAWDMTLQNGIEVRLGRKDVDARTTLFLEVAADIISSRAGDIDFVDMRYSNGFTIGWRDGGANEKAAPAPAGDGLLARHDVTGITE